MVWGIFIVIIAVLIALALLVGIFWDELRDFSERKFYHHKVYRALHYYAEEHDQLLLNNVIFFLGDMDHPTVFDHILFADKYVYLIHDYYAKGALYGNLSDPALFLKDYTFRVRKTTNEVTINFRRLEALEEALSVSHSDKLFVSVVVYNDSLLVPPELVSKEQGNLFLPVRDLERTVIDAEKDDVPSISHEKSQRLLDMLLERSRMTKAELKRRARKRRSAEENS
jgi:hypothetical protein